MPLLRGLARTAAVAGTASVVAGRVRHHQDQKFARQDAEAAQAQGAPVYAEPAPAPVYAAPPPAPAAPATDVTADRLDQLKTLGELKQSGVLTEAEFQAQKAKILAG
ncbi:SHOCT domain-containing protein [Kribbella pittospori]|uniref:SHOCT domain-containing protein n=1 Tax=Kribbella pittospori TaxID=722689 RepID=A0A4R0KR59_9ACTN|nr:SHOCT domain-containing protein [Kribbella pittospori]TCC63393.1 SHOCT domain-containing protein [Kribbella pittospori]